MKLIAVEKFKYGTRHLRPGDEFECEAAHVTPLKTIGKAKEVPAPAPELMLTPKPKATHRRNNYRRRDMRADA